MVFGLHLRDAPGHQLQILADVAHEIVVPVVSRLMGAQHHAWLKEESGFVTQAKNLIAACM